MLNLTLARTDGYAAYGDLSPHSDMSSAHIYPPGGDPPASAIAAGIAGAARSAPNQPTVITEGGYSTLPQAQVNGSVAEQVQAKYTLAFLLDAWKAGVSQTYLYELLDERPDPRGLDREQHFGLFRYDGSAKPAATALHNLTTLLADPGAAADFAPRPLGYSLSGVPATTQQLLLGKSDGSFSLILWNETDLWNNATQAPVTGPSASGTLALPGSASIQLYDPLVGTTALQRWTGQSHLQLSVPDHPIILSIQPSPPIYGRLLLSNRDADWSFNPGLARSVALGPTGTTVDAKALGVPGLSAKAHVSIGVDGQGATTIRLTEAWDTLKTARIEDTDGGTYSIGNFVHADAVLGGDAASRLTLLDVKRGSIDMGAGSDTLSIQAAAASGAARDASTRFEIRTGAGDDAVTVTATTSGTNLRLSLGTGTDQATLAGVRSGRIDGGAGADIVDLGAGSHAFDIVLRHGEAQGDAYRNFAGAGKSGGDVLHLYGFGTGAKLAVKTVGTIQVTAADGTADTIIAPGVSKLVAGDYVFH